MCPSIACLQHLVAFFGGFARAAEAACAAVEVESVVYAHKPNVHGRILKQGQVVNRQIFCMNIKLEETGVG